MVDSYPESNQTSTPGAAVKAPEGHVVVRQPCVDAPYGTPDEEANVLATLVSVVPAKVVSGRSLLTFSRRHIDLQRVTSSLCRA